MNDAHAIDVAALKQKVRYLNARNSALSNELSAEREARSKLEMDCANQEEEENAIVNPVETGPSEYEIAITEIKHEDIVYSVSISNDGKLLATGSDNCTARIIKILEMN